MANIKGEGSIFQRKVDGRWLATIDVGYTAAGYRRRKTVSGTTRNEVIKKRRQLMRDIEDGIDFAAGPGLTVAAWLNHWHENIQVNRVRPLVHANAATQIRRHIIPALGRTKLKDLKPRHIREMHKVIAATPKSLSNGKPHASGDLVSGRVVELAHTLLSKALTDAVREGFIRDNPCQMVDKPKPASRIRQALTAPVAKDVLRTAGDAEDYFTSMWYAALFLGARQSELIGLEWDRVDFTRHTIDLSWQLQSIPHMHGCGAQRADKTWPCGKLPTRYCPTRRPLTPAGFEMRHCAGAMYWTRPKTSASVRIVPMIGAVERALLIHRDRHPAGENGLVWSRPKGTPWQPGKVLAAWHAACDAAKVPRCDMHSTRHTTATLLLEAKVSPEIIQQILGHSTLVSTRIYTHVSTDLAAEALGVLDDVLALE